MAGFAPTFGGGMGIEGAVQTPVPADAGTNLNAATSLLGLFGRQPGSGGGSGGSQQERHAQRWQEIMGDVTFNEATAADLERFGRQYPAGESWAWDQAKGSRNPNVRAVDTDISMDAALNTAFIASAAGQQAYLQAQALPEEQRPMFVANARAQFVQAAAEAEALKLEIEQYGGSDARRAQAWVVSGYDLRQSASVIGEVFTDAFEGLSASPDATINFDEIPELIEAMPGLRGTVLTRENAASVLERVKEQFITAQQGRIAAQFDMSPAELGNMPDDIYKTAFTQLDGIIEMVENGLDASTIIERTNNRAYQDMVNAGVPLHFVTNLAMATQGNPALASRVMEILTDSTMTMLDMYENGAFDEALTLARERSREERDRAFVGFSELAKVWRGTSSVGSVYPEVDARLAAARSGSLIVAAFDNVAADNENSGGAARVGSQFYRDHIENGGAALDAAVDAQPNLGDALNSKIAADFNTHYRSVNEKALAEGYQIALGENDTLQVVPSEETLARIAQLEAANERIAAGEMGHPLDMEPVRRGNLRQIEELRKPPEDINLQDLQFKWSALTSAGQVGSTARSTIAAEWGFDIGDDVAAATRGALTARATPEAIAGATGAATGGDTGGTPQTGSQAPDIGAALGIDFAGYEQRSGLPTGYLNTVAFLESSGNPNAQNANSSAAGLFQQLDANWETYGQGDRMDPVASTEAAVKFAVENMNSLQRRLGRPPEGWELYLAHQQGAGGAAALLSNPDRPAADVLAEISNISRERAAERITLNGGNADMTAAEFAGLWRTKYGRVGGAAPGAGQVTTTPLPAGEGPTAEAAAADTTQPMTSGGGGTGQAPQTSGSPQAPTEQQGAAPAETPAEQPARPVRLPDSPAMNPDVEAFIKSLNADPAETYTMETVEQVEAAQRAGQLRPGDRVLITGDGSPYLVEVE